MKIITMMQKKIIKIEKETNFGFYCTGCSVIFFSQFIATHPLHAGDQLMFVRDLSVQSYLLAGHFLKDQ